MSKKRLKLLRNYIYASNRIDKINNARLLAEGFGFIPGITEDSAILYWEEYKYKFTFHSTQERLHVVDMSSNNNRVVLGASAISKALEEYENELFIKEGWWELLNQVI